MDKKQVENCRRLGMTDEEIRQMLADDKEVDRGTVFEWDLSPEEHKKAMKYANVDEKKKKTAYNLDNSSKKRKENPTKEGIITKIANFLREMVEYSIENVEILNKERKVAFKIGEDWYSVTLTKHRTKPEK